MALISDCDKHDVYRNILTASYVIYPEGGGNKRFPGYVKNGVRHILLQFFNKLLMFICYAPATYTYYLIYLH